MSETPHRTIPEQIIKDIQSTSHVVLFTHSHPDGDALGSLLGFAALLEALGKKVFCLLEESVSHLYSFLPDKEKISTSVEEYHHFMSDAGEDVISIALDCGDEDRLGTLKTEVLSKSPFFVIDHHQSHRDFGTGRWVAPACSSTGEMVYEVAMLLGAELSYNAAFNLYVAICTDTGSFRYECTGQRTMEIAGQLLAKGVKPNEVAGHLYDNFSKQRLKLMELVLGSMILLDDDQIAFMSVTRKMLLKSGATLQDVEGFIDFPRSLKTVKVAVLLKESQNGMTSVSMRAKGECNVADVAKHFGGGGHRNAAGFRCDGKSISQVKEEVHSALQKVVAIS
ncbi:MAG: phosphoesterase RecJ-like protein [Desulforhopalus sp.]|jgi:phosphoesterase RecJ-like protein